MSVPARTPARLAELTRDTDAIRQPANDDTPLWLDAVDAEVRHDLRAIVAGIIAALVFVAILWRMQS